MVRGDESGARGRQQLGTGWDAAEVQSTFMGSQGSQKPTSDENCSRQGREVTLGG